jgi:cytochrome o ubiquinol oxidase subunit II
LRRKNNSLESKKVKIAVVAKNRKNPFSQTSLQIVAPLHFAAIRDAVERVFSPYYKRIAESSFGLARACDIVHCALRQCRAQKTQVLSRLKPLLALPATLALAGCNGFSVLHPMGQIGADERNLIFFATGLMLIVVVPVIFMVLFFAWRYRETNTKATYAPDWSHSSKIEAVVWIVPCVIVGALSVLAWRSSHQLDPYKPIASSRKPIDVDVVSLDWKWLFIYPKQHIASVNELAFPVDTPVKFNLTSDSVMNSFFIPQLGGQIYTMTGMQTQLSLIADHAGDYQGLSANYSGAGFSNMTFQARAMSSADFAAWVRKAKASGKTLDASTYEALAHPSQDVPVSYYASVAPHLFVDILRKCFVDSGPGCMTAASNAPAVSRNKED